MSLKKSIETAIINKMKKFLIFLILFLGIMILVWQGLFSPVRADSFENKVFFIDRGENLFSIAQNLEEQELIKNKLAFGLYVMSKKNQKNLKAGYYLLSPSMNVSEITEKIVSGDIYKIKVTIPEGYNVEQIDEKLTKEGLIEQGEILNLGEEGFMFPDTYFFSYGVSAEEIIEILIDNFNKKINAELINEIEGQDKIVSEVIIMASLIEREVITLEDKKLVSGILWKRLENRIRLQVDAEPGTYDYFGLPSAPICNPGLDSIEAAVYPKDSHYWYYLSNSDKETIFSQTLAEHNENIKKHLNHD